MTLKKEWNESTAKSTAAAQADESVALTEAATTPEEEEEVAQTTSGGQPAQSRVRGQKPESRKPKAKASAAVTSSKSKAVKSTGKAVINTVTGKTSKNPTSKALKGGSTTKSLPIAKEKTIKSTESKGSARVLDSQVAYEGPLFRVLRDHLIDPSGREAHRDVIRHNGSVVILAVDHGPRSDASGKKGSGKEKKNKKDPWIVIERQYRHAAGQYLWELPAGKLEAGEVPLEGAKRELGEETGYQARKWAPLVEYYASPGFLGEAMKVFLAEGLIAGDAHPEEDESIDFRLVRLSEILKMVDKGKIIDGKTLTSVLLYARQLGVKHKK